MASNFPTSADTFDPKEQGEVILPSHVNALQEAVEAIQSTLGTGVYNDPVITLLKEATDPGHSHTGDAFSDNTIPEAKLTDGNLLARLADDEIVSGAWIFSDTVTLTKASGNVGLALPNANLVLAGSTCKIGIGTETLSQKLNVYGGLAYFSSATLSATPTGGAGLFIGANLSSSIVEGRIQAYSSEPSIGEGYLTFWTNTSGNASTEKMRIDDSGFIGMNCIPANRLQVTVSGGAAGRTVAWRYDSDVSDSLLFDFQRGTASKSLGTGIPSDTLLFRIRGTGWDGSSSDTDDYDVGAEIRAITSPTGSTWTSTDHGTALTFYTTNKSSTAVTKRMTITPSGNIIIGANSSGGDTSHALDIEGSSIRIRGIANPAPSSSTANGDAGTICWDTSYLYVCVGTNSWKRVQLSALNW